MKKLYEKCDILVIFLETKDAISTSGPIVGTNPNDPLEMPEVPLI